MKARSSDMEQMERTEQAGYLIDIPYSYSLPFLLKISFIIFLIITVVKKISSKVFSHLLTQHLHYDCDFFYSFLT